MALPKVIYDAGAGAVTLQFVRGPQDFRCFYSGRVHDNVATSGLRERVVEGLDMIITFGMQHVRISDDYQAWAAFAKWALGGGMWDFYPDAAVADHYHCVSDDEEWEPVRNAPGKYAVTCRWRIVPDDHVPSGPDVVMRKFYGL